MMIWVQMLMDPRPSHAKPRGRPSLLRKEGKYLLYSDEYHRIKICFLLCILWQKNTHPAPTLSRGKLALPAVQGWEIFWSG
jgi:hypothetical protein